MSNELDLLLDEWKALEAAATPGPWHWEPPSRAAWPIYDESLVTEDGEAVLRGWGYDASGIEGDPADRKFIALSRTLVPRLIAAVEAVLDRARMEQDDAEFAMTYAAQVDDGSMLVSQQARKQAWADAARALRAALTGDDKERSLA